MIEALVALLVLALGVLGLARLQVGALTESRNTNARAVSVQLAADLAERMQSNAVIRRANPTTSGLNNLGKDENGKSCKDEALCVAQQRLVSLKTGARTDWREAR